MKITIKFLIAFSPLVFFIASCTNHVDTGMIQYSKTDSEKTDSLNSIEYIGGYSVERLDTYEDSIEVVAPDTNNKLLRKLKKTN